MNHSLAPVFVKSKQEALGKKESCPLEAKGPFQTRLYETFRISIDTDTINANNSHNQMEFERWVADVIQSEKSKDVDSVESD